jgi:hypothetical protein
VAVRCSAAVRNGRAPSSHGSCFTTRTASVAAWSCTQRSLLSSYKNMFALILTLCRLSDDHRCLGKEERRDGACKCGLELKSATFEDSSQEERARFRHRRPRLGLGRDSGSGAPAAIRMGLHRLAQLYAQRLGNVVWLVV